MSTVQFARIREQGVEFGVVVVKDHAVNDLSGRDATVAYWSRWLGVPTVLVGANNHRWYGRKDLVRFMANVSLDRIPWREATLAA